MYVVVVISRPLICKLTIDLVGLMGKVAGAIHDVKPAKEMYASYKIDQTRTADII